MKKIISLLSTILTLTIYSCYYDSEEALFPKNNKSCDTTNVTYSITIKNIISGYCLSCHSNSNAPTLGSNYKLEDFIDVSNQADLVLGSIQHKSGFFAMPSGGAMLDSCLINQFAKWIKEGKPNN